MIENRDKIYIKGKAYIRGFNRNNETIFEDYTSNMIVNSGLLAATMALSKSISNPLSGDYTITKFDVGDSNTDTLSSFTSLQGYSYSNSVSGGLNDSRLKLSSVIYPTSTSVRFSFGIPFEEFNGKYIKEVALYTENNTMFNRIVYGSFLKDLSISISGYSEINFSTQ